MDCENDPRWRQVWLLGQAWRIAWGDFDGRTLRSQIEGIIKGDNEGEDFYCRQCRDCGMDDVACLSEMDALWEKFKA